MNYQVPINFSLGLTTIDMTKLDNGKLYIGKAHQDPRTNPVNVFLDNAMTIFAPPFLRIKNGYIWHNGNIVNLYANEPVSALLLDVYDRQLWYFDSLASGCELPAFDTEGRLISQPPTDPEAPPPSITPLTPYTAKQTKSVTRAFVKECNVPGKSYQAKPVEYTYSTEYQAESWESQEDAENKLQILIQERSDDFERTLDEKGRAYAEEHGVCEPVETGIVLKTMHRFYTTHRYDHKDFINTGDGAQKADIYIDSNLQSLLEKKLTKFEQSIGLYIEKVRPLIRNRYPDSNTKIASLEHASTDVDMLFEYGGDGGNHLFHNAETIDKQDIIERMLSYFTQKNNEVVEQYNGGLNVEPKSAIAALGSDTTTTANLDYSPSSMLSFAKQAGSVSITLTPHIKALIQMPEYDSDGKIIGYTDEEDWYAEAPSTLLNSRENGIEMISYFVFSINAFDAFLKNKEVSFGDINETQIDGDDNAMYHINNVVQGG